ncbi:carboxypeptidase-like regulatory domain-containing protein [Sedimenticola selenatireducens]|uniref:carboxypeptidase-like regulatory domain-containing protein n=1 Tax=Sedimenticola selenatireducens TaxID=191960 RepID=UPI00048D02ED|nr:carboxypeptidase-like regulatory domain-containing protein [Sedimenticola selenatireducens]
MDRTKKWFGLGCQGVWAALWMAMAPLQAATLSGVVADEDERLAKVEIILVDADSRITLGSVYTGADGQFRFTVERGKFDVGAFKSGYVSRWTRGIGVGADDVAIEIGLVNEAFAEDHSGSAEDDCN